VIVNWSWAVTILAATAVLDAAAAVWVWRRRGAVGRISLVLLLVAAGIWCATYALELATSGRAVQEFWGSAEYLGTTLLPPAWLAFVLEYTGRRDQLSRRTLLLLAIEPVLALTALAVPATHDLVRSFAPGPLEPVPSVQVGPLYWVHFAYTNALVLVATVVLVARLLRVSSLYRRQSLTLAVAVVVPLIGNLLSSVAAGSSLPVPFRVYDPTPVAASLGALVLVWGAFRYRLLDLVPVARNLAFDRLDDPILVLDAFGRVIDRNPAAARLLGAGSDIGTPAREMLQAQLDPVLDATPAGPEIRLHQDGQARDFELIASPLQDAKGRDAGQLLHLRDISARKDAERRLRWLADYDQLTGLPNRRLLMDRLDQAIARARRARGRCALLLVDLDRFKLINDSLGHPAGDQVLTQIAGRLRTGRRDEDTAARVGGDEFALLLPEITSGEDAKLVSDRLLAAMSEPLLLEGRELIVTASIGVAVWPDDAPDSARLFSVADAAMYRAKAHGRARAEAGPGQAVGDAGERLGLGVELRHALRRGELRLHYQPLVDLYSGSVLGMEALLRWEHPRLGLLPPASFLDVAAETGLSIEVDRWVLGQACEQAGLWAQGGRLVPVSVNVSAERFQDAPLTLTADVARALDRAALPPQLLILEINERTIIDDPDPVAGELLRLRELGVGVALDDFGAGHTSLTHLRRLPIGMLKIDHELVRGIGHVADDLRILSAVTTLAHILGMTVTAEGVEHLSQVRLLQESGCNAGQGFLFSPPVDPDAARALLHEEGLVPS
jgi:diguanylate cyclase (GGDEF)-like protein/PAS domain S-box-containing protein